LYKSLAADGASADPTMMLKSNPVAICTQSDLPPKN